MIAARAGAVVNVASAAALQAVPTMAVHGATKSFVLSFTEALWEETRRTGVRVLALCQGPTDTAFHATTGKDFLTAGRRASTRWSTLRWRRSTAPGRSSFPG